MATDPIDRQIEQLAKYVAELKRRRDADESLTPEEIARLAGVYRQAGGADGRAETTERHRAIMLAVYKCVGFDELRRKAERDHRERMAVEGDWPTCTGDEYIARCLALFLERAGRRDEAARVRGGDEQAFALVAECVDKIMTGRHGKYEALADLLQLVEGTGAPLSPGRVKDIIVDEILNARETWLFAEDYEEFGKPRRQRSRAK